MAVINKGKKCSLCYKCRRHSILLHLIIPWSIRWALLLQDESAWPSVLVIDEQFFLSPTSLFALACQVKWCVLVGQYSFIPVYGVEPLLSGQAIKDISMHDFVTGNNCMRVGLVKPNSYFTGDWKSWHECDCLWPLALHYKCNRPFALASFSSSSWGAISVGFLSLFWSALMCYCARGAMVESRKESVFPLFCSSEHRTIILWLDPREGVHLNNGFCVGIYPAAWLV